MGRVRIKDLQWRSKLGTKLMEIVGQEKLLGTPHIRKRKASLTSAEKQFILDELPDGYSLWRHIKRGAGASQKASHAAAGHQRSDVYLYGHPGGKTKRYRSPDEFLPHLYWLVWDETGNAENCG